mgnify:CR=1 FL=1
MLLRQRKYFTFIVKNNSFTEAAEECYILQSAISQQIQALEADLGITLLAVGKPEISSHSGRRILLQAGGNPSGGSGADKAGYYPHCKAKGTEASGWLFKVLWRL